MTEGESNDRRGVYNIEYFSGSQASIYIGDVLVDEVTSMSYQVSQSRSPLYGYADQLYRDVSKGVVLVQGEFSINFKEAGYLWLILNRYKDKMGGGGPVVFDKNGAQTLDRNIEQVINGDISRWKRNKILADATSLVVTNEASRGNDNFALNTERNSNNRTVGSLSAELRGFSSNERANGSPGGLGSAENKFEAFENEIWNHGRGPTRRGDPVTLDRRCDEPDLNNFDIFVTFGDYQGSDVRNHTVQKLVGVHILGTSKQVVIDGQPIQEVYSFIARNII